jgi:hypothetical protein
MMPRTQQYHGTTEDRLAAIEERGLDRFAATVTMRHSMPAVFTADKPEIAALYGDGTVLVLKVAPRARYLTRRQRTNMRRGENLLAAVERWIREASDRGYAGVYVPDQQSGVGNITIDPSVLSVIGVCRKGRCVGV